MNHKTNIITSNYKTLGQIKNWMTQQIPQLKGKSEISKEGLMRLQQNRPKFEFVNLKDLSVEAFLQLQQMENPAYSIVFVNQIASKPRYIKLKIEKVTKCIPFEKIIRLEACSNYTQFYLSNTPKPILTSKTLKFYLEQLSDTSFVRPHKSHLVNRNFIEQVVLKPKPYLILNGGSKICISRRKVAMFKGWRTKKWS